MNITASNFRGMERNTLKGFVDLTFADSALTIRDATLHEQNGRRWIGLPGKPIVDPKTGVAERYPESGKIRYVNVINFDHREASDAFQREALAAIARLNGSAAMEDAHAVASR